MSGRLPALSRRRVGPLRDPPSRGPIPSAGTGEEGPATPHRHPAPRAYCVPGPAPAASPRSARLRERPQIGPRSASGRPKVARKGKEAPADRERGRGALGQEGSGEPEGKTPGHGGGGDESCGGCGSEGGDAGASAEKPRCGAGSRPVRSPRDGPGGRGSRSRTAPRRAADRRAGDPCRRRGRGAHGAGSGRGGGRG